ARDVRGHGPSGVARGSHGSAFAMNQSPLVAQPELEQQQRPEHVLVVGAARGVCVIELADAVPIDGIADEGIVADYPVANHRCELTPKPFVDGGSEPVLASARERGSRSTFEQ